MLRWLAACGAPQDPSSKDAEIRGIWVGRCGSCHLRVEPGTRSRVDLEAAMQRHRTRLKLKEAQWAGIVELLAPKEPPP